MSKISTAEDFRKAIDIFKQVDAQVHQRFGMGIPQCADTLLIELTQVVDPECHASRAGSLNWAANFRDCPAIAQCWHCIWFSEKLIASDPNGYVG